MRGGRFAFRFNDDLYFNPVSDKDYIDYSYMRTGAFWSYPWKRLLSLAIILSLAAIAGCSSEKQPPDDPVRKPIPSTPCIVSIKYGWPGPQVMSHAYYVVGIVGDSSFISNAVSSKAEYRVFSDMIDDSLQFAGSPPRHIDANRMEVVIGTNLYPDLTVEEIDAAEESMQRRMKDWSIAHPGSPPPPHLAHDECDLLLEPGIRVQMTRPSDRSPVTITPCR